PRVDSRMVRRFFWALIALLTRATGSVLYLVGGGSSYRPGGELDVLTELKLPLSWGSPGAVQRPSSRLMRLTSALATDSVPSRRRVSRLVFFSRRCRRPACSRRSLPLPVTLMRFAVPLWVLFFGIYSSSFRTDAGRDRRCAPCPAS